MLFGRGNRDQTCQTCWKQLPYGFKFMLLFTLAYNVFTIFLQFLLVQVYFDAYLVVHQFQIWRLLFSYFPAGVMPTSIFNILIDFFWLLSIYPVLEKKFSTSFILVQTFLQNLIINLILSLGGIIVYYLFSMERPQFPLFSYGLWPIVMIFIWYQASQNPDQYTNFCCIPCLIQMKWIPVIILAISLLFSSDLMPAILVAFVLGYLQFMHFKRRLIKLPVKFYRKIDSMLPKSISDRPDYVKVQNVQADLILQCQGPRVAGIANPFNRNNQNNRNQNQQVGAPNKVQVMGKGVSLGGQNSSNVQSFKGFWANKQQNIKQQIQIEPTPIAKPQYDQNQSNKGIDQSYFIKENDSHFNLNINNPDEKESQEELEQKDEKKAAKRNLLE